MTPDRIVLTIPREQGFEDVAQLVVGGAAARLSLTFEGMDDLGIALASLLERGGEGDLTVELVVDAEIFTALIGPFDRDALRVELEREDDGVGLGRVLGTVVDSFASIERPGGAWIELQKRIERVESSG